MLPLFVGLFILLSPGFLFTIPLAHTIYRVIAHAALFFCTVMLYYSYIPVGEAFQAQGSSAQGSSAQGSSISLEERIQECINKSTCSEDLTIEECKVASTTGCRHIYENNTNDLEQINKAAHDALQDHREATGGSGSAGSS